MQKGTSSEDGSASSNVDKEEAVPVVTPSNGSQSVNVLVSGLNALDVSSNKDVASSDLGEAPNPGTTREETEKRIRALKKKVRFQTSQENVFGVRDMMIQVVAETCNLAVLCNCHLLLTFADPTHRSSAAEDCPQRPKAGAIGEIL